MATFLQHINLNKLEIRNASIEKLSSDPTGGNLFEGRIWLNTTDFALKYYSNSITHIVAFIDDTNSTTLSTYSSNKIDTLLTAIQAGTPWRKNIITVQTDNTLDPGATPTTGDRYALNDIGNLNANFGTIAGVGNGDIVEYDGADFIVAYDASVQNPDGGSFVYADGSGTLYVLNGSLQWVSFIVAATTTVSGIVELATQTETEATTDAVRAVTPASLVQFGQIRVLTNQSFVVNTPKILTHGFGNTGKIQKITIFPTGTNSGGGDIGDFTNNGDGTVSVTLASITGNPFDVYFMGTNS